jgi:hypothetical protein
MPSAFGSNNKPTNKPQTKNEILLDLKAGLPQPPKR